MENMNIGWIGLGHMGVPISANLIKAGYSLTVYNRTCEKAKPLIDKGATFADSTEELCKKCNIIFIMVSDDDAVKNIFSKIITYRVTGKLFINMSTVSPDTSKLIYDQCLSAGAKYLEAPVSGSVKPATDGTLIVLAGGDKPDFDKALPLFDKIGKLSLYMGNIGQGAYAKLAINYYLAITIQGIAETVLFAEKNGIKREVMMQIINEGACGSAMSNMKTASVVSNTYPAAFPLKHMAKDVRLACEQGLNSPMANPILDSFQQSLKNNLGDEDVMAVIKSLRNKQ